MDSERKLQGTRHFQSTFKSTVHERHPTAISDLASCENRDRDVTIPVGLRTEESRQETNGLDFF